MPKLEKFLKESKLPQEAKDFIMEAWNEEKQELAATIRDEMKTRFEQDKASIVEGLDKMAQVVIESELTKVYTEKRKLVEDRAVLRSNLKKFTEFSNSVLAEEIQELRGDRAALTESVKKFALFSNKVIATELVEFQQDKRDLAEARVKLIAQGKQKINEAKQQFVKHATKNAAAFIETQTRKEFTQLRGQLQEAQKNMFGRKIFEAFATEFMSTQYNESKEINKIMEGMKQVQVELQNTKQELSEAASGKTNAEKKIRIMEDRNQRSNTLGKLMKPLNNEQRMVMEGLLEQTPTAQLEADFKKYLKPVLKESGQPQRRKQNTARSSLTESRKEVTGNREHKLFESNEQDDGFMSELNTLTKFAGIRK